MKDQKNQKVAEKKPLTDKKLVAMCQRGSLEAFEELVSRYEAKAFNLAMRFTRCREDAEEVLQDVFSTVYRKIASFQGKSAFSSWLYRITVNAAYMKLRKRKQDTSIALEDLTPNARQLSLEGDTQFLLRSDTLAMGKELRDVIEGAIDRLPSQYRAVFILRDVDGLSNQEVGRILELSVPAVKSRLHRSRIMLRRRLHKYYSEFTGRRIPMPPRLGQRDLMMDGVTDYAQ